MAAVETHASPRRLRALGAAVEEIAEALWASRDALDPSLASGLAGAALFLGYLGRHQGSEERLDQAATLLQLAMDAMDQVPGLSLYAGFPGIVWCVEHLRRRVFPPGMETPFPGVERLILQRLDSSPMPYDLLDGLTGLGVVGLALPPAAGKALLSQVLDRLERLAVPQDSGLAWRTPAVLLPEWQAREAPDGYINLGMAHGLPGILALLARMAERGIERTRSMKLLEGGLTALSSLLEANGGTLGAWYMPRRGIPPSQERQRVAWCYGDLGASFALARGAHALGCPAWWTRAEALAIRAALRPQGEDGVEDPGLCHGAAGNAHLFNRWFRATGSPLFREAGDAGLERALAYRSSGRGFAGFSAVVMAEGATLPTDTIAVPSPGFLAGAAGIGLAFLAFLDPGPPAWDACLLAGRIP